MKISKETMAILKNFSTINSSIFVRAGNELCTISKSKNILATATVTEDFPQDFAIYDLARFLGALSLFEEPELEFGSEFVTIKSAGKKHSIKYVYSSPDNVNKPAKSRLELPSHNVEFDLDSDTVKDIVKASGLMSLPNLQVTSLGDAVQIVLHDSENSSSSNYTIETQSKTDSGDFIFSFKVENMKLLDSKYDVAIYYEPTKKAGFGYFKGSNIEYWIAVESDSKVG